MSIINNRKIYVYRYKICEDYNNDRIQVAGTTLTKEWSDFKSPKEELASFIRTTINPSGFIDYEKKDLISNEIIQQSTYTGEIPDIIAREVLYAMDRHELIPIAKYYRIDCVNKNKDMIVKLIIEGQSKRLEFENKQKEIKTETIIQNVENRSTEEINQRNGFFGFGLNKK